VGRSALNSTHSRVSGAEQKTERSGPKSDVIRAGGRRSGKGAVSKSPAHGAERWSRNLAAPLTCSVSHVLYKWNLRPPLAYTLSNLDVS